MAAAPAPDLRTDQVVPRQLKTYELEDEDDLCSSGSPVELALESEERAGERWRKVLQRHADVLAT